MFEITDLEKPNKEDRDCIMVSNLSTKNRELYLVKYHDGSSILVDDTVWKKTFKDIFKALKYAQKMSTVPSKFTITGTRIINIVLSGFE